MGPDVFDINRAWLDYLVRLALARDYAIGYRLDGHTALPCPPLEDALPALEYIKMAAILDDALEQHLTTKGPDLPKGYRPTLGGRIRFFADRDLLPPDRDVRPIGHRRNRLAHEPASTVDWATLDADIDTVHAVLEHLGYVGVRPVLKVRGERSHAYDENEPGVLFRQDYSVRVEDETGVVGRYGWTTTICDDEVS